MSIRNIITRPIVILSLVSLFTDMASEMLYPIMPIYLDSIGFSIRLIAILEGVAEMTAGLSKGYFGQLSDLQQKRLPFVRIGYLLSALSKPMLAISKLPVWIFFARTTDRLGKGIRTAPRDALLSDMAPVEHKAKIFGFHRSMDTLGAVLGPLAALLFLYLYPGEFKILFLIAFAPGLIAVAFTFFLKEEKRIPVPKKIHFLSFLKYGYGKNSNKQYQKLLTGLVLFSLINSSDVLLLLKMKEEHIDDLVIITLYIIYNLAYALLSFPAGMIADKLGISKIFIFGLMLFGIVYTGFAFAGDTSFYYLILFCIYGFYAACTEGIAKAWITRLVPKEESATAIGTFSALSSICALIASTTSGILWYQFGAVYAFGFTALCAFLLIFYFLSIKNIPPSHGN